MRKLQQSPSGEIAGSGTNHSELHAGMRARASPSRNSFSGSLGRIAFNRFNIACAVLAVVLGIEARFENAVYESFVARIVRPQMDQQQKLVALLHGTSELFKRRRDQLVFNDVTLDTFKAKWIRSGDTQLLLADEACGGAAAILVEAAHHAGLAARVLQMRRGGVTVHVMAEVLVNGTWAVADPSFDQLFPKTDGTLASFDEVSANWDQFKAAAAPDYELHGYRFESARYTDWNKIPVVLPIVKGALSLFFGAQRISKFSLRSHCLNVYDVYLWMLIGLFLTVNAISLRRALNRRRVEAP